MVSILKYVLILGWQRLEMPLHARIIHVGSQRDAVTMWALVEEDDPVGNRLFRSIGTGQAFDPDGHEYLGTAITHNGDFVWHVFEERAS